MDFNTILTNLRHQTVIQFFIGAYVKTQHPGSFNPALSADTRPVRIITSFISIAGQPGATTVLDSQTDTNSTLTNEDILLSDLELFSSYQRITPKYVFYQESYWLIVGREHSLLKALKLTDHDYNIEMDLISESICEILTKQDMETITGINLRTMLVPLNLSVKPLIAIEIIANSTTISKSAMPNLTVYSKLTPIDSTENSVSWSVLPQDQSKISVQVDSNDSRIAVLTFNEIGVATVVAKSLDNNEITNTLTFIIEA